VPKTVKKAPSPNTKFHPQKPSPHKRIGGMSSPTQTIDDLLLSECEATPEVPEDFANVLRAFFPRAAHLVNTLVFPDQSLANINIGSHIIAVTQEGHAEWRSRSPDTTTQILASRENLNPASLNWVAPKILAIANKTFRDAVHPDNLLPDLQAARNAALDMCTPRMVVEEALEHQPDLPWRPHKNRPNTYFVTLYYSPFRAELITCGHLFIAWKENRWQGRTPRLTTPRIQDHAPGWPA